MLRTRRIAGQFQGCFSKSKWGGQRESQKWDLFCEVAPELAKKCQEVPNHMRQLLGIDTLKHQGSKFGSKLDETHQIPVPLMNALEETLMERMQLGEEVTSDFAEDVLRCLLETWNNCIEQLREHAKKRYESYLLDGSYETDGISKEEAQKQLDQWMSQLHKCAALTGGKTFKRHVQRVCGRVGVRKTTQTRQSRHLSYDNPQMESVRMFVASAITTLNVHPRLIAHFDQVWSMQYEPPTRTLFKQPANKGKPGSKQKPSVERIKQRIAHAIGVPMRESGKHSGCKTQYASLCAGSTMVPIEYARHPRTTTTLSWSDGVMGRAYVTANTKVVPASVIDRMNDELKGILFIDKAHHSKTHMWSRDTMVSYLEFLSQELRSRRIALGILPAAGKALILCDAAAVHSVKAYTVLRKRFEDENNAMILTGESDEPGRPAIPGGWGACGAPNDAWHQFFHSLRRSYMRVCAGQGAFVKIRQALGDIDLSIDGAPRYTSLSFAVF